MRKPLIVLVSGAPGSGKSTLARTIADYMKLPHIERDTVLKGLEYTAGKDIDRPGVGVPIYYETLRRMAHSGISFVTDGTIYRGISESDIKSKILPVAHVINIHARAKNEHQRWYDREIKRETYHSKDWIEGHLATLEKVYEQAVEPLELGIEVIEVNCDDGYKPTIKDVVGTINERYNKSNETTN